MRRLKFAIGSAVAALVCWFCWINLLDAIHAQDAMTSWLLIAVLIPSFVICMFALFAAVDPIKTED